MVGCLLITHPDLGKAFISCIVHVIGELPAALKTLEVGPQDSLPELEKQATQIIQEINKGEGVLLLTDLLGATPSNLAQRLIDRHGSYVKGISGLNLSMLIRFISYRHEPLQILIEKLMEGGMSGIYQLTSMIS